MYYLNDFLCLNALFQITWILHLHYNLNAESSQSSWSSPTLNMVKFVLLFNTNRPLANLSLWIFSEFFHYREQSSQDAKFSIPPMVMKFTMESLWFVDDISKTGRWNRMKKLWFTVEEPGYNMVQKNSQFHGSFLYSGCRKISLYWNF